MHRFLFVSFLMVLSLLLAAPQSCSAQVDPVTEDLPMEMEAIECDEDELFLLKSFIGQSEMILGRAKEIRSLLDDYQKIQVQVAQTPEDRQLVWRMLKQAALVFEMIEEEPPRAGFHP